MTIRVLQEINMEIEQQELLTIDFRFILVLI